MAPTTVGLFGHNGLVGAQLLKELAKLDSDKIIKLIVIYRPGSNTEAIPAGIEQRHLDIESPDGVAYDEALKGIEVVLSALGKSGTEAQVNLIPALKRSKDLISWIPSEFGSVWSEDEIKNYNVGFLEGKRDVAIRSKKEGLPVTEIYTGCFPEVLFQVPLFGWNVKENTIWSYNDSDGKQFPFVSTDYLAKAVALLVQRGPQNIANKAFYIYDITPTLKDIANALSDVNGKSVQIVPVNEQDLQGKFGKGGFEALGAGLFKKAVDDNWNWHGERIEVPGWKKPTVQDYIRATL